MHRRLRALASHSRIAFFITILAGLSGGLLTIWQASLISQVINWVFRHQMDIASVFGILMLALLVIILRGVAAWAASIGATSIAVRVKTDLRQRLFEHLLALGPAYAHSERTGELAATATEGIEALDAYFSQYLPQLFISALVPLAILLIVFPLDLLSGIILLLTAPLVPVFMILIGRASEVFSKRQFETLSRLSAHFLDSLQGLTTLKLFGASKTHAQTVDQVNQHFRDVTLRVLSVTFLSALALELIATLSTAVVAVEVGLRLLYHQMVFEQALFLLIIAPEFYIPMRMLGLRYHAGMSGVTAAKRIFEILDSQSSVISNQYSVDDLHLLNTDHWQLNTSSLSYTYPGQQKTALDNINLEIKSGQHIALVGPSGSGKSTLVSLLLRFIEPDMGQLTLNGMPLSSIHPDAWRAQIAWVSQKPYLFNDTIAANLRLAQPNATDDELIVAARAAHLHDFIQSLPQGYQTPISEAGARLSGGEAQRLALARAFLKDAPILILDEPTSSLDPRHEALLEDSIHRLMQGRTVITIAHRLNTILHADQIIVLDQGRIVETGTHAQLIANSSLYTRLVGANIVSVPVFASSSLPTFNLPHSTFNRPTPTIQLSNFQPSSLPTPIRLLAFLDHNWRSVFTSIIIGSATIASSIALMGTSAYLISNASLQTSIADLQLAIVSVRFFGIMRGLCRYYERLLSHNIAFRLLARLRTWFYTALEPLAPARLMQYRSGDLLSRVVADVETLENFYVRAVSPPLVALVISLGASLTLGLFYPLLGWVLLGFLLALGVLAPLLVGLVSRTDGQALLARRADLHAQLVDGIQGMADLVAFGRQAERARQIAQTSADYAHIQRRMGSVNGINDALGVLLPNLAMWTILILAIPRVSVGEIPGVMLASLALITLASFEAVSPLPQAAQMFSASLQAARRLFEVVDTTSAVREPDVPQSLGQGSGALSFENVSFGYGEGLALNGISFQLAPGHSLAIVGPSGAGKSTLVNLLLRFWDYEQGKITLAEHSLKDFSSDEARTAFAVVSQSTYFFNATIRQNLLIANAHATQDQLEAAARKAQIHDFIAGLPQGYDTWIGEHGLRLSGGERQRLAVARALLKDAPILLLDEPTANLDPITERALLDVLFGAQGDKTTLMITHRLVSMERFNEILVLDGGQIVQRGTHNELIAEDGLYRQLWMIQNRVFLEEVYPI